MHDESASHNFHLRGPGVDQSTQVAWTGTVTWNVSFSAGTYTFVCDPHNDFMNGSFTVGSGPPPPPPPPPPPGELVLTGFVGPGYDIGLRDAQGNDVNGGQIPAGAYRIEIYDYSPIHNFELKGDDLRRGDRGRVDGPRDLARDVQPGRGGRVRMRPAPQLHVRLVPGRLGWPAAATTSATASTSAASAASASATTTAASSATAAAAAPGER